MSIFAIGDLHLPGGDKKPMDVFGAHWERHFERICADWQSRVKPEDIVLENYKHHEKIAMEVSV